MFDRESPLSLTYQVEQMICYWVIMGKFKVGEFLPPQQDLEAFFGVSRITIRSALSKLREQGIVCSYQGKGTKIISLPNSTIYSTKSSQDHHVNQHLSYEQAQCTIISAEYNILNTGQFPIPHWKTVHLVRGVRWKEEFPIAVEDTYLNGEIISHFSHQHHQKSQILQEHDIVSIFFREEFFLYLVAEDTADLLTLPLGTPLLGVKRTSYSRDTKEAFECRCTYLKHENYGYLLSS